MPTPRNQNLSGVPLNVTPPSFNTEGQRRKDPSYDYNRIAFLQLVQKESDVEHAVQALIKLPSITLIPVRKGATGQHPACLRAEFELSLLKKKMMEKCFQSDLRGESFEWKLHFTQTNRTPNPLQPH